MTFLASFLNAGAHEEMPLAGGLAADDAWQGDADVSITIGGDVPLVGIGHVSQDNFLHVNTLTVSGLHGGLGCQQEGQA